LLEEKKTVERIASNKLGSGFDNKDRLNSGTNDKHDHSSQFSVVSSHLVNNSKNVPDIAISKLDKKKMQIGVTVKQNGPRINPSNMTLKFEDSLVVKPIA